MGDWLDADSQGVSHSVIETANEADLFRIMAALVKSLDRRTELLDLLPELIDNGLKPLQMRVGYGSHLTAPAASLGFLLIAATQMGCAMREAVFRAVKEELRLDPWLLEFEARLAASPLSLAYYGRKMPNFYDDRNAYALHPVAIFPPPGRFKTVCDARRAWDKHERRARKLKPWYALTRKWRSDRDGLRYSTVEQVIEARAGMAFLHEARRNPEVLCQWHTGWTRTDFEFATQVALNVCQGADPWTYENARDAVCAATGQTVDSDPITRMAWHFIGDAIQWSRGFPRMEGTHRLCLARSLGVAHVLAVVH